MPVVDLDDIEQIADVLLEARDAAAERGAGDAESLMAQLTDDCFAFSGPLLPIPDMERMIAERVQPVSETETVRLPRRAAGCWPQT